MEHNKDIADIQAAEATFQKKKKLKMNIMILMKMNIMILKMIKIKI